MVPSSPPDALCGITEFLFALSARHTRERRDLVAPPPTEAMLGRVESARLRFVAQIKTNERKASLVVEIAPSLPLAWIDASER